MTSCTKVYIEIYWSKSISFFMSLKCYRYQTAHNFHLSSPITARSSLYISGQQQHFQIAIFFIAHKQHESWPFNPKYLAPSPALFPIPVHIVNSQWKTVWMNQFEKNSLIPYNVPGLMVTIWLNLPNSAYLHDKSKMPHIALFCWYNLVDNLFTPASLIHAVNDCYEAACAVIRQQKLLRFAIN